MQTPIYLVVETSGSNAEHDYAKLEKFLEEAYEEEIIVDGTIAQDSGQQASIWALRENISEGLRHAGTPAIAAAVTAAAVTAAAAAVTAATAVAITAIWGSVVTSGRAAWLSWGGLMLCLLHTVTSIVRRSCTAVHCQSRC